MSFNIPARFPYLSAYGIAVKHGFVGTEEEWLESIKGKPIEVKYEDGDLWYRTVDSGGDWLLMADLSDLQSSVIADTIAEAQAAATAAALSETNAAVSEANAAASEANAESYKNLSQQAANNAAISENNATQAASDALGNATQAAAYASSAEISANDAISAEQNSELAKSIVLTSEANALEYKNAAETAATTASGAAAVAVNKAIQSEQSASAASGERATSQQIREEIMGLQAGFEESERKAEQAAIDANTDKEQAFTYATNAGGYMNLARIAATSAHGDAERAEAAAVGASHYKGEVQTYSTLPTDAAIGDTYKVKAESEIVGQKKYVASGNNSRLGIYNDSYAFQTDYSSETLTEIVFKLLGAFNGGVYESKSIIPANTLYFEYQGNVYTINNVSSTQYDEYPNDYDEDGNIDFYYYFYRALGTGASSTEDVSFYDTVKIWADDMSNVPDGDSIEQYAEYQTEVYTAGTNFLWNGTGWIPQSPESEIKANSIGTENLAAGSVTAEKLATGSVNSTKISGSIPVNKGGTGKTSWSANRLIYASTTYGLNQLANPPSKKFLAQNATGAPFWSNALENRITVAIDCDNSTYDDYGRKCIQYYTTLDSEGHINVPSSATFSFAPSENFVPFAREATFSLMDYWGTGTNNAVTFKLYFDAGLSPQEEAAMFGLKGILSIIY